MKSDKIVINISPPLLKRRGGRRIAGARNRRRPLPGCPSRQLVIFKKAKLVVLFKKYIYLCSHYVQRLRFSLAWFKLFFFLQALYQSVNRRLCLFQDLGDVGRDTKEPVQSDGVWKRRALLAGRFTQYHSKYCMCFAKKKKPFAQTNTQRWWKHERTRIGE